MLKLDEVRWNSSSSHDMEEYQEIIARAASGQVAVWNSSMPKDKWKLIKSFCDQSAGTFVLALVKLRNSEGTDTL